MKLPICAFDAKTGILCPKCDARLKSRHITKTDVNVSVKLSKLSDKMGELARVTLVRALDVEEDIVLLVGKGDGVYLRSNPRLVETIEKELKSKVWVIDAEAGDRNLLEDIFYPAHILTVNVVWLPDGSKLTKVIVPSRRGGQVQLDVDKIKGVAKAVRGIDLLVEVES
ncbi:MAG: hypothetical protein HYU39_01170 [Thaumarchaeota archaeon]|nr:hypothetical protein [Nitrososphaerota archaeon]